MNSAINISDIANVAELIVATIGFVVTIIGIYQAKVAAQKAEQAAIRAKEATTRSQTLTDFGAAVAMMEEIKRLHRVGGWAILPERYGALRAILISIQVSNPNLAGEHLADIQGAVKHLSDFEARVEKWSSGKKEIPDSARFNSVVSLQIDKLNKILTIIKQNPSR